MVGTTWCDCCRSALSHCWRSTRLRSGSSRARCAPFRRSPRVCGVWSVAISACACRPTTATKPARSAPHSTAWRRRCKRRLRPIAHELHDEFGQSVTAIRSLAMAISGQATDSRTDEAARLISTEAARLYDAMHGLIPRLAPLSLDSLGLAATLDGLIKDWQRRYPAVRLTLEHTLPDDLGPSVALTVYRVVQEGLINALRHAQPGHVTVRVQLEGERLSVTVEDDGKGLPADWARPGHFGLRGLRERVLNLGGAFAVDNRAPKGVRMAAEIPLVAA